MPARNGNITFPFAALARGEDFVTHEPSFIPDLYSIEARVLVYFFESLINEIDGERIVSLESEETWKNVPPRVQTVPNRESEERSFIA